MPCTFTVKGCTIWYPEGGMEAFWKKKVHLLLRLKKKNFTNLRGKKKKKKKINPTQKSSGEIQKK